LARLFSLPEGKDSIAVVTRIGGPVVRNVEFFFPAFTLALPQGQGF
jgi:hypothetical protein